MMLYIFKWSQPITGLHDNYTNTLIKVFPNPFAEKCTNKCD